MNIVFLFNSSCLNSTSYSSQAMESILNTGVLQLEERDMRISIGDVLTYSKASGIYNSTHNNYKEFCTNLYKTEGYNNLIYKALEKTYETSTVFCWLFENINFNCAIKLHNMLLIEEAAYLGSMEVNFSNKLHLQFFRKYLIEAYRIHKRYCSIFYTMASNENPDHETIKIFQKKGFQVVFEDMGARKTIFDRYNSLEHYSRIQDFRDYFCRIIGLNQDIIDNVTLSVDELHPRLFDVFSAAARTLKRAETVEDLAQASLSGRRVLEKLANYLYPPSNENYKGYKVGKEEYKNRLWAYIDITISEQELDNNCLNKLGKELDRIVKLFNKGLHSDLSKEKIEETYKYLFLWILEIINLSPNNFKKPYLLTED